MQCSSVQILMKQYACIYFPQLQYIKTRINQKSLAGCTGLISDFRPCYHPQQSCGKVMFLHVSVILVTGRGLCQGDPPDRDPPSGQTPPLDRDPSLGQRPLPWTETPSLDRDPSLGQRPPCVGGNQWAVRILLECILVYM